MPTVLLINPNSSTRTTAMMLEAARSLAPPGTRLRGIEAASGPAMILDPDALAAAEPEVVRLAIAEASSVEAIIVAAFGDPGVAHLRDRLRLPVIGIGEASLREAADAGRRFAIVTTTPHLASAIEAMVERYGFSARFTGLCLTQGDPVALASDAQLQDSALAAVLDRCFTQGGADAVVIGGGPLSASAGRLRARYGPAIIEPLPAAMRAVSRRFTELDAGAST